MRGQVIKTNNGSAISTPDKNSDFKEVERLAELGRLSSSILHEISNPITSALLYLEQYKDQPAAAVRKVHGSIKQMWQYVEAARQQVRGESESLRFNVADQLDQLKRVVMPLAKQAEVSLIFELPKDCVLYGDPVKFQQAVANLIINAIDSYSDQLQPGLQKNVRVKLLRQNKYIQIEVIDWGAGIKPKDLQRIFEPFYSTKHINGKGLGIGLAIVRQYVTVDFKGTITVASSSRSGTRFCLRIPSV